MHNFTINTMTCGGCAAAITRAIKAVDATAQVLAAPETHHLEVASKLSREQLFQILDDAGYTPEPETEA